MAASLTKKELRRIKDDIEQQIGVGCGLWVLIPDTFTEDQVVKQVFKLLRDFEEHEARENFLYRGHRIVGPHQPLPEGETT